MLLDRDWTVRAHAVTDSDDAVMTWPATARCGDVALAFGSARPTRTRSGDRWTVALELGPARLWTTVPDETWSGFPMSIDRTPRITCVTVGDRRDHWIRFEYDHQTQVWAVQTDRFATLQAYRRIRGDPLVATFSPALWGDDPSLDWTAVAGFLALGWYPGDRMPVEDVRILRPATTYRWDANGRSPTAARWSQWRHEPHQDPARNPGAEMDDLLSEILDGRSRESGPIGVPLSGGLDSRSTLAVLTRADGPTPRSQLRAFSYGYAPDSIELEIATELAAVRGLPIDTFVVEPYLLDDLDLVLAATEGLVDLTSCRQAVVLEHLERETAAVVAAHWGDVWFGMADPGPDEPLGDWLLRGSRRRGGDWLLTQVIGDRVERPTEQIRSLLRSEAESLPKIDDRVVAASALKTEQWSLRFTEASIRMHEAAVDPILPYYDARMADLALSLPSTWLTDRRLQIDHLRSRAPDLAAVTWQAFECDLFGLDRRWTTGLPRRLVRGLHRRVRPPKHALENWEVQFQGEELMRWDRWLQRPSSPARALVEPPALNRLIERVTTGDRDAGHALARLITFAAWQERYT